MNYLNLRIDTVTQNGRKFDRCCRSRVAQILLVPCQALYWASCEVFRIGPECSRNLFRHNV